MVIQEGLSAPPRRSIQAVSQEQAAGKSDLPNILIFVDGVDQARSLTPDLVSAGFACSVLCDAEDVVDRIAEGSVDIVLIDMRSTWLGSTLVRLPRRIKKVRNIPVVGLLAKNMLQSLDGDLYLDDFVVHPCDGAEVAARVKLLLWRRTRVNSDEMIKCGDLVIDLAKCEVSLGRKPITLTFKEYELLRFMASNRGRVFTREELLNEVWGYDYYGGDRTVDVHITRLRSKIEDSTHIFIETVRNIGYKFRDGQ